MGVKYDAKQCQILIFWWLSAILSPVWRRFDRWRIWSKWQKIDFFVESVPPQILYSSHENARIGPNFFLDSPEDHSNDFYGRIYEKVIFDHFLPIFVKIGKIGPPPTKFHAEKSLIMPQKCVFLKKTKNSGNFLFFYKTILKIDL